VTPKKEDPSKYNSAAEIKQNEETTELKRDLHTYVPSYSTYSSTSY